MQTACAAGLKSTLHMSQLDCQCSIMLSVACCLGSSLIAGSLLAAPAALTCLHSMLQWYQWTRAATMAHATELQSWAANNMQATDAVYVWNARTPAVRFNWHSGSK
jgi:hypothetical protein